MLRNQLPTLIGSAVAVAILLAVGAIACSSASAPAETLADSNLRPRNQPEWLRTALDQSREMMESRCVALAPLDLVYTSDPTFEACMAESSIISANALHTVYEDALRRCVAQRASSCCFAAVTDDSSFFMRRQRDCDDECARLTRRGDESSSRNLNCQPKMVSPPRPRLSRAHTPAVVEIVSRCQRGSDEHLACEALPTHVERGYCRTYCERERSAFQLSLSICERMSQEPGGAIRCNLRDPDLRSECESRCRERAKSTPAALDTGR